MPGKGAESYAVVENAIPEQQNILESMLYAYNLFSFFWQIVFFLAMTTLVISQIWSQWHHEIKYRDSRG